MSYGPEWYDARWDALSPEQRKLAADTIATALSTDDKALIRFKYAKYGPIEWIHNLVDMDPKFASDAVAVGMANEGQTTLSGHHGFGTQVRNALRSHAGIRDEDLPPVLWTHCNPPHEEQNWDDYYIQAIEAAVGLREV